MSGDDRYDLGRYVTGTPEWVVHDALTGACFAECRAQAEREARIKQYRIEDFANQEEPS